MTEQTLLFQLREAKRKCSNLEYKAVLGQAADSLAFAIGSFSDYPTKERMTDLNCVWAFAVRVLKEVPPEGEPAPIGGAPEPAKLALAA